MACRPVSYAWWKKLSDSWAHGWKSQAFYSKKVGRNQQQPSLLAKSLLWADSGCQSTWPWLGRWHGFKSYERLSLLNCPAWMKDRFISPITKLKIGHLISICTLNIMIFLFVLFLEFIALLDNYESETGREEVVTQQEKHENQHFIDAIYETEPMKIAHEYLAGKGLVAQDQSQFKRQLYDMWFTMYSRTGDKRWISYFLFSVAESLLHHRGLG